MTAVADTIVTQLGGRRIFAMAFDRAVASEDGITLRIAKSLAPCLEKRNGKRPTHVRVTLDESTDTFVIRQFGSSCLTR